MVDVKRNWRRIVGGIGFVLAVAWLAGRGTCKAESASATIRFRVGDGAAQVRSIRAELHRGDDPEVLAYWERNFDAAGSGPVAGPWNLRADAGAYRVDVVVRTDTGTAHASRQIELADGASITVDVSQAPAAAR
jgi:hypothetical protein